MALQIQHIDPLDLQPSTAVGVNLPFSGEAVFNSTYLTKDAIKNNIINYFLTNKGERYMNPNFGSNIRKLLFENVNQDTLDNIEAIVASDIGKYFSRVTLSKLEVTSAPDTNTVRLYIRYSISDTNIEDEILVNIDQ